MTSTAISSWALSALFPPSVSRLRCKIWLSTASQLGCLGDISNFHDQERTIPSPSSPPTPPSSTRLLQPKDTSCVSLSLTKAQVSFFYATLALASSVIPPVLPSDSLTSGLLAALFSPDVLSTPLSPPSQQVSNCKHLPSDSLPFIFHL